MLVYVDTFQDPNDLTIKIKLHGIHDNNPYGLQTLSTHLLKEIIEGHFNKILKGKNFFKLSFLQLFISQYLKPTEPLKTEILDAIVHMEIKNGQQTYITPIQELQKKIELQTVENPFIAIKLEDESFSVMNGEKKEAFTHSTVIFTLPNNPLMALQFLACLSVYLKMNGRNVVEEFTLDNFQAKLNQQPYAHCQSHIFCTLLDKILTFDTSSYEQTIRTLNAFYKTYQSLLPAPEEKLLDPEFIDCLGIGHCSALWPDLTYSLLNPELPQHVKINKLLKESHALIHAGKGKELSQLLISINYIAKRNLLSPCIGQKAHDQKKYKWKNRAEFLLLLDKSTYFTIKNVGSLCITNFAKTDIYKLFYAEGRDYHNVFQDEMIYLFKLLELEFAPCGFDDFHKEMVFTEESSKKLLAKGMHFNLEYVDNLLKLQNYSFFCRKHMKQIPKDSQDLIAFHASDPMVRDVAAIVLKY